MKLIVSKIVASVNEIEIDLNASNWKRIKAEIESVQEEGRCEDVDVSSQKKFIDCFIGNEELHAELFDILASNDLGVEEVFLDSSNETFEGRIEG
ncbi:hypothetical protein ICN19_04945 [Polynucleobacter sp. AP-Capit-er-40B-B4]|uniref:hypothetical protein n=1 Tax=Polynucleobacter sp. AP-Capit-er-40B-B4 TaxID=2576927 RepID=UPI001C0C6A10|nr:hypothetical protein [Polynucleobacter sp. AP-Capit-er-40B-B4]MBU3581358.1 hypothetical protein [Polynucleobacter sp. AP-Capit-er-40B-B4]